MYLVKYILKSYSLRNVVVLKYALKYKIEFILTQLFL